MADFETFCDHYGYDPRTAEARAAYDEYCRTLRTLHAAAMKGGSQEGWKQGGDATGRYAWRQSRKSVHKEGG